jgi:pyruvate dehydrogenase E1 component
VVWGREWDALLQADKDGALVNLMNTTPDGDFQTYKANDGTYVREHFFGRDPRTKALVQNMSDAEIWNLKRGGHDYRKVYAAYRAAMDHKGQPTVILAKTIKGYTLGSHFQGRNATHQMKKLALQDLKDFRDAMRIPISDAQLEENPYLPPYYHPGPDTPEIRYLLDRRTALGGFLPERRTRSKSLTLPPREVYKALKSGSGTQGVATTMATVRVFKELLRETGENAVGPRIVPIIPDEARTFGMDSWFPTLKIYNRNGQLYTAVDAQLMLAYKESEKGQILHEGINEAGSTASFTAVGSSYSTHNEPMIPVYIFYSMFGFQRTGDSFWAAADQMARGFVLGATAGRTTLTGEGLQHADGHSMLLASTNPAVVAYDPAFAYEIAYIVESGLSRMFGENPENVFFYVTIYNEPYVQPAEPENLDVEQLLRGMYRYRASTQKRTSTAQILASGVAMPDALRAAEMLAERWDVAADVWSVTSWNELHRDGLAVEKQILRHPDHPAPTPFVTEVLAKTAGPVVAVSDWMRAVPEQIRPWVPNTYVTLGTDGFGFSDTRPAARRYFNTDAESVVVAVLEALARDGEIDPSVSVAAAREYRIDDVLAAPEQTSDPGVA